MGGGESTAEKYAKFGAGKYSSSDFERYVDSSGDLAAAWNKIESDPTAWDSKYWIDKGATSKAAFGRAHAAEDAELYAGTYGSGGTKVVPGSAEYDAYFGDRGGTRFDTFTATPPSADSGEISGGLLTNPGTGIGPYPADNMYFPQLTHAYETPQAQDWSQYGLLDPNYQPWSVQGGQQFVPENIWNYAPPQINRQPVQYMHPMFGPMEVIMPEEESKSTTNPNDDPDGQTDGQPGYTHDNLPTFTDTMKSLFDLDDFDKWAENMGKINAGSADMGSSGLAGMAAAEAQEADEASKDFA